MFNFEFGHDGGEGDEDDQKKKKKKRGNNALADFYVFAHKIEFIFNR